MAQEPCTLSQEQINDLAAELCSAGFGPHDMLFQSKANRDAVYQAAKKRGASLRRRRTGHCLLDPRYTVEGRHIPDRGLANDYDHSFGNLYELERVA